MANFAAGWMVFWMIAASAIGPAMLLITEPPQPTCWMEKRLVNENYQPRTGWVRVCEVK